MHFHVFVCACLCVGSCVSRLAEADGAAGEILSCGREGGSMGADPGQGCLCAGHLQGEVLHTLNTLTQATLTFHLRFIKPLVSISS